MKYVTGLDWWFLNDAACGVASSETGERRGAGEGGSLQYQPYRLESPERVYETCSTIQVSSCTR